MNLLRPLKSAALFYYDGVRHMTWGRPLWIIVGIKLVIIFVLLRCFLLRPSLTGSEAEKQQRVVENLSAPAAQL